jgi:epoxyqueuosine reductase
MRRLIVLCAFRYSFVHSIFHQQGFNKVAVLSVAQATQLSQQASIPLQQWLNNGHHADMDWLSNSLPLRQNPALLMPNVQTVVVVALNYYQPLPSPTPVLRVARYAWGYDYHKVLKRKLKAALRQLQTQHPGLQGRPLVDSAPVMEKALAVGAGFGWQGKHSNIISPDYGSWLFFGVLLLDQPFTPDPITVTPDYCGRCTRCVTACPTQAIDPHTRSVNSHQCLAYWTIENTTEPTLPQSIAENQQGWVFGCDICQEVCPWNDKKQNETQEVSFLNTLDVFKNTPEALLNMNEATFSHTFQHSSAKRTGLAALQRNILSAANN